MLRFSHNGRTLFPRTAGNKTPEQLDMQDEDVLTVHDATVSRGTAAGPRAAPVAQ